MEMRSYVEKAQKNTDLNSLSKLSSALGLSQAALSGFLIGRAIPADKTMLKLANLAGIPAEQALIDVSLWRNKDNPEVLAVWLKLQKKLIKN